MKGAENHAHSLSSFYLLDIFNTFSMTIFEEFIFHIYTHIHHIIFHTIINETSTATNQTVPTVLTLDDGAKLIRRSMGMLRVYPLHLCFVVSEPFFLKCS